LISVHASGEANVHAPGGGTILIFASPVQRRSAITLNRIHQARSCPHSGVMVIMINTL
jgi:hypothetical protein